MTTYTTDRANSGEIPRTHGEDTRVIRRLDDTWIVTLPASARIVSDPITEQLPALPSVGIYPPDAPGRDAWITSGDIPPFLSYALHHGPAGLQGSPAGDPPKLPPPPPPPSKRVRFRHARRLSPWIGVAIVVGTGLAMWAGGFLAGWVVMGR